MMNYYLFQCLFIHHCNLLIITEKKNIYRKLFEKDMATAVDAEKETRPRFRELEREDLTTKKK